MTDSNAETTGTSRRSLLGIAAGVGAGAVLGAGLLAGETGTAEAQVTGPLTAPVASITLAGAHKLLMGAQARAQEINVPMTIVVVDAGGQLKAAARMDGNRFGSLEIVRRKAITAVAFGQPTHRFGQGVFGGDPARAASFANLPDIWLGGGGLPIVVDGQVVGGIGVGGGTPEQDIEVAQAGLDALGK